MAAVEVADGEGDGTLIQLYVPSSAWKQEARRGGDQEKERIELQEKKPRLSSRIPRRRA